MKPEVVIGRLLLEKKLTLGTAESCTGGRIAGLITAVPGSSAYFKGGIVAYSNEVKQQVLSVSGTDLGKYGAVSEPVVLQMVTGARQVLKTDCAVSTSGIAGPDGGTPGKPVGTVWIAVSYKEKTVARKFHFSGCREENILSAANAGLNMLIELLDG
ncbi:MAG: CinA family protein [Dysgonamonadaceae bacterium]|jgi:PncC family amidohydrolase|nr:CinA family protein [Dysgonamonadaceae bacterium]